mgnify:CR=1 FL=1
MTPIQRLIKRSKKCNYYEGSYDAGTYKGTQYALPYESVPTLMLVNKTLLKKRAYQNARESLDLG